jgi:hypothetical protein
VVNVTISTASARSKCVLSPSLASAIEKFLACSSVICGGQRRHFRVGLDLQHHGNVARKRLLPGGAEHRGGVDVDTPQADHVGETRIGDVRNALRCLELGIVLMMRCSQVTWLRSSLLNTQTMQRWSRQYSQP